MQRLLSGACHSLCCTGLVPGRNARRGIDRGRRARPIEQTKVLCALKQPAVDEDALCPHLQQLFGAGDRFGRAKKRESHDLPEGIRT